jgi:hypothetical protein
MKPFLPILIYISLALNSNAQSGLDSCEKKLYDHFLELRSASGNDEKLKINDSICWLLSDYVRTDSIFSHRFSSIRNLGQITSSDSSLKMLCWNLLLDDFKGKYFTYLVNKNEDGKIKVYFLSADYNSDTPDSDTTYSQQNWYGALYYDARSFYADGEKYWTVLGIDFGDPEVTRKIIDVLSFDKNDSIIFGKKLFETSTSLRYRRVFQYASSGTMTLRFISDTSIVFDHLVPIMSENARNRVFYGSDYSYDSYVFQDGTWKFRLNVDARNPQ